ncbi:MAG: DUF1569 domain-containing protein [Tepidisphaeraceae bacterium]
MKPFKPRIVKFNTEADAIAEIERLRAGPCAKAGNWNLQQILWHVTLPIRSFLSPPAPGQNATPEQAAKKAGFVDVLIKSEGPPKNFDAPPAFVPAADLPASEIDVALDLLRKLAAYPHASVYTEPFGPIPIDEWRKLNLLHASHHLSYLIATPRRENLRYADDDACIADIRNLAKSHVRVGNWTFEQICWHINAVTETRMSPKPGVVDTDEQKARRPIFDQIMKTGLLPTGIVAPDFLVPPTTFTTNPVEQCIATLTKFKTYPGPMGQHRVFGSLTVDEGRRINLIHSAHHLSYLVPAELPVAS